MSQREDRTRRATTILAACVAAFVSHGGARAQTQEAAIVTETYAPFTFSVDEEWTVVGEGDRGLSRMAAGRFKFDFTRGARWVAATPGRGTLLGDVKRLTLRIAGSAAAHPLWLEVHRYRATYRRSLGSLVGDGPHVIAVDAPPGAGWEVVGETDERGARGPLRLGQIRLDAGGVADEGEIRVEAIAVETSVPEDRRCSMVARHREDPKAVAFEVELRALSSKKLKGVLSWTAANWQGRAFGPIRQPIEIPEGAKPTVIEVPVAPPSPELRFAEIEISVQIEGQRVDPATATWVRSPGEMAKALAALREEGPFPGRPMDTRDAPSEETASEPPPSPAEEGEDVVQESGDAPPAASSPIGVALGLARPANRGWREKVAERAQEAGVRWTRETFSWPAIEPSRGAHDWATMDEAVEIALAHHIAIVGTVSGWPSWIDPTTDEALDAYVELLATLVDRYGTGVDTWEIWDAPDTPSWPGTPEQYARLLAKVSDRLGAGDGEPPRIVVTVSQAHLAFAREIVDQGGRFDVLGLSIPAESLDETALADTLRRARDAVVASDGTAPPPSVWLMQVGYPAFRQHAVQPIDLRVVGEREQAALVARVYAAALAAGLETRIFWRDFVDSGADPFAPEQTTGLLRHNLEPKPAFSALATLARMLDGRSLEGAVDTGRGNTAYRFEGAEADLVVAWNTTQASDATLEVDIPKATIVNAMGETKELTPIVTDRGARLLRGALPLGAPVFVLLRPPLPHEIPPPALPPGAVPGGPDGRRPPRR